MNDKLEKKLKKTLPLLNENQKRKYLAIEAESLGYGGISEVSRITGVSRSAITRGKNELKSETPEKTETSGLRKKGGGRKKNN
jgi:DNA-binding MurR/RpiR family transcriptional regulator